MAGPGWLVSLKLETCHANSDGVAWYAYTHGVLTDTQELEALYEDDTAVFECDGGALGVDEWEKVPTEVPNALTRATGLRRWYVASAG